MSELEIYNEEKKSVEKITLPEFFGKKANRALIHQVVLAHQANRRQGNAKVKTRHEVAGSTRKIYRQKGTGGARHGDIKAPIFVGGGRAFGPKPRSYEIRVPQKIKNGALREALVDKQLAGKLYVFTDLKFKDGKTKAAQAFFNKMGVTNALVVTAKSEAEAKKAVRNIAKFSVTNTESLSLLEVLRHDFLVMTKNTFNEVLNKFVA